MDIPCVPNSIPRARIIDMIRSLGLEPGELAGFEFTPHAIYAEVYALKDGGRYFDGDTNAAKHRIAIPITDDLGDHEVGRAVVDAVKAYEGRGQGPTEPTPA